MSNKRRHHYLPVCYLNYFRDSDGKVFKLDFKSCDFIPRFDYPKNICYITGYYEIPERFKSKYPDHFHQDPLFIEKEVFKKFENSYHSFFNKITKDRSLSFGETKEFSRYLLQLKIRNLYWQNESIKNMDDHLETAKNSVKTLIEKKHEFSHIPSEWIEVLIQLEGARFKNDKDSGLRIMLERLIEWNADPEKYSDFIENMINSKWILLINTNKNNPFITTDNPGYSVHKNNGISNVKLADGYRFFFPISPEYCLYITDLESDSKGSRKKIHIKRAELEYVNIINNRSLMHFNNIVISNCKTILSDIKNKIETGRPLS